MSRFDLKGRRALVTGASSGIGLAITRDLARRGAIPILVARRADRLAALAEELRAAHGVVAPIIVLDLLAEGALDELERQLDGPVDVLVNNAAFGMNRPVLASDPERLEDLVRLGLEIPIRLTRRLAGPMVERRSGAVLNVASIASFVPTPHHAVYAATKAAFLSFSEGLALEVRSQGVRVTALCPGVTDTEFFAAGDYVTESPVYRFRMAPGRVAKAGLDALERGRISVVTGLPNRLLLAAVRLLPSGLVIRAAGRAMATD